MNKQLSAYFEQFTGDVLEPAQERWIVRELGTFIKGRYATYQEASIALEQHRTLDREAYEIFLQQPGICYGREQPWDNLPRWLT